MAKKTEQAARLRRVRVRLDFILEFERLQMLPTELWDAEGFIAGGFTRIIPAATQKKKYGEVTMWNIQGGVSFLDPMTSKKLDQLQEKRNAAIHSSPTHELSGGSRKDHRARTPKKVPRVRKAR